jgi:hypothetical protein
MERQILQTFPQLTLNVANSLATDYILRNLKLEITPKPL